MDKQLQQRFCTNCGQPLAPGAVFCAACGTQASVPPTTTPGQLSTGAQPGYVPPYAQAPTQDDPLLANLTAGYLASRMGRNPASRARRPWSGLSGCGCLLLTLVILAGPFIGLVLTTGRFHLIFTYLAGGMVILFCLLLVIVMLTTRSGREALADGCLDAILSGLLGGG